MHTWLLEIAFICDVGSYVCVRVGVGVDVCAHVCARVCVCIHACMRDEPLKLLITHVK